MAIEKKRKSLFEMFLEKKGLDPADYIFDDEEELSETEVYDIEGLGSISVTTEFHGSNRTDTSDWPDERTATCPSCNGALKKVPGAKTKCPNCSEFVYVRTDPRSQSRRVVNESELEDIEDAWAMLHGTYEERQQAKADRESMRLELTQVLGRFPSEPELDLHEIKIRLEEFLLYRQMGLVRNSYLERGQLEYKVENFHAAALCYLAVVLIDGNGGTNAVEVYDEDSDGIEVRSALGMGFDPSDKMYLPYLAKELVKCMTKGNLSEQEILRDFDGLDLEKRFSTPIKMSKVWSEFVSKSGYKDPGPSKSIQK